MTPVELGNELDIDPKRIRDWLRKHHPRSAADHGRRWHLDVRLVAEVRAHFS